MAKKTAETSAKANLLLALGAITVADKLPAETMSKITELHTLLSPPKRERKKRTPRAVPPAETTKDAGAKKPGFKVAKRPADMPAPTPAVPDTDF